jgi:hypothetical protein
MKNKFLAILFISLLFIASMILMSCSNSETDEKGTIEKINEKNAEAAKDYINDPLDKAKKVQKESEQRVKETDDILDEGQ